MIKRILFLLSTFLLISILTEGALLAHQKKEAVTRIIFNERTNNIEVIHRFMLHDAEHATKKVFGSTIDILGDAFSRKHFADYVKKNFSIKRLSGDSLNLADVGSEIGGRFIWIYQETPLQKDIKGLVITHGALGEIWPEQTNLVNIERQKQVQSLVFKGKSKAQKIIFKEN
jgi:hypothetical protein